MLETHFKKKYHSLSPCFLLHHRSFFYLFDLYKRCQFTPNCIKSWSKAIKKILNYKKQWIIYSESLNKCQSTRKNWEYFAQDRISGTILGLNKKIFQHFQNLYSCNCSENFILIFCRLYQTLGKILILIRALAAPSEILQA